MRCPNPACENFLPEYSESDGATVCANCCTVVEENAIVSSVEFNESSGGGSATVVGTYVGANCTKAYSSSRRGRGFHSGRDSRETTIQNGRRAIQQVASQLRLGATYVDQALRLFTIAVDKNFVQGRKTSCVVAVCLYVVCRTEDQPHMLIDFSDVVQTNVYVLGAAFLKFKQLLPFNLRTIDPSLFIPRFAARLELGSHDEEQKVANTALRLVASMKRDWIHWGRRPAGICGAALYLAALFHDVGRPLKDIAVTMRISAETINKRLEEFKATPAARMTQRNFSTLSVETFETTSEVLSEEVDPPSFLRAKQQRHLVSVLAERGVSSLSELDSDERRALLGKEPRKAKKAADEDEEVEPSLYKDLHELMHQEELEERRKRRASHRRHTEEDEEGEEDRKKATSTDPEVAKGRRASTGGGGSSSTAMMENGAREEDSHGIEEFGEVEQEEEDDGALHLVDLGDMSVYIRPQHEATQRERLWNTVNRAWLEKKERQRVEKEEAAARGEDVNGKPAGRKRSGGKRGPQPARVTAGDAVNQQLSKRRISKKINYDAIKLLGGCVEGDETDTANNKDKEAGPSELPNVEEEEMEVVLSPPTSPTRKRVRVSDEEEEEEEEEREQVPPAKGKGKEPRRQPQEEGDVVEEEEEEEGEYEADQAQLEEGEYYDYEDYD